MAKHRTNQEWQTLLAEFETTHLTKRAFFLQHNLSQSRFYAKRQQAKTSNVTGFVKAQVIEPSTLPASHPTTEGNMVLSINEIKLSLPQGTSAHYIAQLIGALS